MKPTHILVPIEKCWPNETNIPGFESFKFYPEDSIKVDLSEEGIDLAALKCATEPNEGHINRYVEAGYLQCAKDLLNTKP